MKNPAHGCKVENTIIRKGEKTYHVISIQRENGNVTRMYSGKVTSSNTKKDADSCYVTVRGCRGFKESIKTKTKKKT